MINMTNNPPRRLACWMSERKSRNLNWQEFRTVCIKHGYELFSLDLNKSLQSQSPIHVFVHKLTDLIASAKAGSAKNLHKILEIEHYFENNTSAIVLDPIIKVRQLLDRHVCYGIIRSTELHSFGIFTPNFCDLETEEISEISQTLKSANVTYPFICKPIMGHGSKDAHEMSIIFNEEQLSVCRIPSVAQSFINHNAVVYKLFLVGSKYICVRRSSIRNFYTTELNVIRFQSSEVSRALSKSDLCVLDPEDRSTPLLEPNHMVLGQIAKTIRNQFGMDLLGIDILLSRCTSRYAIIDVNAFPGYRVGVISTMTRSYMNNYISSYVYDTTLLELKSKLDIRDLYSNNFGEFTKNIKEFAENLECFLKQQ